MCGNPVVGGTHALRASRGESTLVIPRGWGCRPSFGWCLGHCSLSPGHTASSHSVCRKSPAVSLSKDTCDHIQGLTLTRGDSLQVKILTSIPSAKTLFLIRQDLQVPGSLQVANIPPLHCPRDLLLPMNVPIWPPDLVYLVLPHPDALDSHPMRGTCLGEQELALLQKPLLIQLKTKLQTWSKISTNTDFMNDLNPEYIQDIHMKQ